VKVKKPMQQEKKAARRASGPAVRKVNSWNNRSAGDYRRAYPLGLEGEKKEELSACTLGELSLDGGCLETALHVAKMGGVGKKRKNTFQKSFPNRYQNGRAAKVHRVRVIGEEQEEKGKNSKKRPGTGVT